MVLKKVKNVGEKDIVLDWGQWTYRIPVGGTIIQPPEDAITAMQERYQVEVTSEDVDMEVNDEPNEPVEPRIEVLDGIHDVPEKPVVDKIIETVEPKKPIEIVRKKVVRPARKVN